MPADARSGQVPTTAALRRAAVALALLWTLAYAAYRDAPHTWWQPRWEGSHELRCTERAMAEIAASLNACVAAPGVVFGPRWRARAKEIAATWAINDVASPSPAASTASPAACIAVVTVPRIDADPLALTMAALLRDTPEAARRIDVAARVHIAIVNAAPRPDAHEAAQRWAARVPVVALADDPHWVELAQAMPWAQKETLDYAAALDYCAATGAPLAAVFEDDAMPSPDGRLLRVLQELMDAPVLRTPPAGGVVVRLFATDDFRGFGNDWTSLQLLVVAGVLVFGATLAAALHFKQPGSRAGAVALAALVAVNVVLVLHAVGRQNLVRPGVGLAAAPWSVCCTQALLYDRATAARLAQRLRSIATDALSPRRHAPVDLLLSDAIRDWGMRDLVYTPAPVQHVGQRSSSVARPLRWMLADTFCSD